MWRLIDSQSNLQVGEMSKSVATRQIQVGFDKPAKENGAAG